MKMHCFGLLVVCLCGFLLDSAFALGWGNNRQIFKLPHHDDWPHYHEERTNGGWEKPVQGPYYPQEDNHRCSCLLLVGNTQVFGREDRSSWYSCNRLGLHRCEQFCTEMFQDADLRYRSRQDACDVIGKEIYTSWYRRNQVCGSYGPFGEMPLHTDLCCRRGRPSNECTQN